jgi:hypothetical protein
MTDPASTRIDLLDRSLKYCTADYDLATATFAALDSKAQATFGVAGVFVAGTVALLNSLRVSDSPSGWAVALVVLTYVLLVASIATSLISLKVREVATPIDSASVARMTLEVVTLPDEELTDEVRANWYRDQLGEWKRVIQEVDGVNSMKGRWLVWAQALLLVAIICAGLATLVFGAER